MSTLPVRHASVNVPESPTHESDLMRLLARAAYMLQLEDVPGNSLPPCSEIDTLLAAIEQRVPRRMLTSARRRYILGAP